MRKAIATIVSLALGGLVATAEAGAVAPAPPPNCGTPTVTSHSSTAPTGIPTGPAVVTSTIDVAGAGAYLTDVDLFTDLEHTFAADLDITLQSPAGTLVTISTDNGADNDNVFKGTTFDDQADPDGQVPYTTNPGIVTDHPYANLVAATPLDPEESLAAFHGEDPNGTWTITISDDLAGDGGTLQSWRLDLQSLAAAPATAATPHSSTAPTGIPTGPAVVTSTIDVAGAGAYLTDVDLFTDLEHTFAADLDITLQSPAGTLVTISTDNGAGNDNVFKGTTFDDQADPDGQVPYTTNPGIVTDHPYANLVAATPLDPEESLAAFHGEDPNGTWTITISDDLAGDGGTLQSWRLDLTTGSCASPAVQAPVTTEAPAAAPPPGPAPVAAEKPAAEQPPSEGKLRVSVDRLSVFAPRAEARCRGANGACHVRVLAAGRVIARGTAKGAGVPLRLTGSGRRLLERRFGGMRARVVASDTENRARARTRAILMVERITTPPGSFAADHAELTPAGQQFVRRLRARMVRVTGLVCDGHTARPEGEPQPEFAVELSLARATNVCGRKAKLLAHGSQDPIVSNTDEAGRAQNRRVEITVRHDGG